jgi:hypothetical protein
MPALGESCDACVLRCLSGSHGAGHRKTECYANADAHRDVVDGHAYGDADHCAKGDGAAVLTHFATSCRPLTISADWG